MRYGSRWRNHRRMFHQWFNADVAGRYCDAQQEHARILASLILKDPSQTRAHVYHAISSTIFSVLYGRKILKMDDKYLKFIEGALEGFNEAMSPGKYWIENFPFLRHLPSWLPGANAKRVAAKYAPWVGAFLDTPFNEIRDAMRAGKASPSLTSELITYVENKYGGTAQENSQEQIAKDVIGIALAGGFVRTRAIPLKAVFTGGADTTASSVKSFLLAMALHPDVQVKGQAELDSVVGQDRLPVFDDIEQMPYVRAIVKEVLRWMPVVPFAVPHVSTEDIVINGYHIPKRTIVLPNVRQMAHDPQDYPEPERFMPERFLNADNTFNDNVRDPATLAFGFGRRICPGRYFALNNIAIVVATVLHTCKIETAKDASGKPISLRTEQSSITISSPLDIPCGSKARSESMARLVSEANAEFWAEVEQA
ncbi:hypothetical protein EIP91_004050 [Steccherinum ochraceum]|uniref:Cytochrome P450 n=1 Tax=Steccherinum ochraceum TaxID=92696 RepID=A0A4R0RI14_9APHY|nr:hypothetical protein EIP91_004050 [Steccherinum ochraceum]